MDLEKFIDVLICYYQYQSIDIDMKNKDIELLKKQLEKLIDIKNGIRDNTFESCKIPMINIKSDILYCNNFKNKSDTIYIVFSDYIKRIDYNIKNNEFELLSISDTGYYPEKSASYKQVKTIDYMIKRKNITFDFEDIKNILNL